MSLTDDMADDLAEIETLAKQAENDIKNGNLDNAEDRVNEIKELAKVWQ